jgi:tetratricopeptide (TPR) repeat protein
MLKADLEKIVTSLSAIERKSFRIHYKHQSGDGKYGELFEMYLSAISGKAAAETSFRIKYPTTSFDNTAAYLFKVLTEMLTMGRIQQDPWFGQLFSVMKAKLFTERSMPERALKELRRTQHQAENSEDHLLSYLCSRIELSQLARVGFANMTQQELIDFQMRGKKSLQVLRQIHEHHSLYEILSHKLLNKGITVNEEDNLDDLVLSELGIITRGSSHRFESKKLHLLFQAYFFIHKSEYSAALELFKKLNTLMEGNESILDFPPYDYLDTLDGILNSLLQIRYFDEMQYFISKIEGLLSKNYPEHFLNMADQMMAMFQMSIIIGESNYAKAIEFHDTIRKKSRLNDIAISPEKHITYYFQVAIAYFKLKKIKSAKENILKAINIGRYQKDLLIFRACWLFQMVLYAESGDNEFISYEIRAYKRAFSGKSKIIIPFERILFEVMLVDIKSNSRASNRRLKMKINEGLDGLETTPSQLKLLQYFDFIGWIHDHLSLSRK